jgi:alginate O-acetyltransferase complex protein AlgI
MQIFTQYYILISLIILSLVIWKFNFPYRTKTIIISIYSLIVIGFLHPVFLIILLAVIMLIYYLATCVKQERLNIQSFLTIGLIIAFITLLLGKYGKDIYQAFFKTDSVFGLSIIAPIGITYFAIKLIQLVINIRRGIIKDVNFIDAVSFLVFLPTFAAGPIESYETFKQANIEKIDKDVYFYGIKRILFGYFKKFFITDVIISFYLMNALDHSFAYYIPYLQFLKPLCIVILTFFKAYFDLSAYSDIAIGFSRLLGFKIVENFNRPFWKRNISDFWRSWHISLSRWSTSNVYFPVFGATRKVWLAMYASMIVMGMLHFVNLNWLAWGIHHATGLVFFNIFSKYKRKHKKVKAFFNHKVVKFFSHLLTFFYVSLGYGFVGGANFIDGLNRYVAALMVPVHAVVNVFELLFRLIA